MAANSKNTITQIDPPKLVKIGEAAKILGVSIDSLRRWEKSGKLSAIKTPGGTRYYSLDQITHLDKGSLKYRQVRSTWEFSKLNKLSFSQDQVKQNINLNGSSSNFVHKQPLHRKLTANLTTKTFSAQVFNKPELKPESKPEVENFINQELLKEQQYLFEQPLLEVVENPSEDNNLGNLGSELHILYVEWSKLRIPAILLSICFLIILGTCLTAVSYFVQPQSTKDFFAKQNSDSSLSLGQNSFIVSKDYKDLAATALSPFNDLASQVIVIASPQLATSLGMKQSPNPTLQAVNHEASSNVLAASFSNLYLEVNSDTSIKGSLAVDGDGAFTGKILASNLLYSLTAGTGITVSTGQSPTVSSTDTLALVTGRGGTTSQALTLNGAVTLGNILTLGSLSSDPSTGSNGESYYNTSSSKFRCYQGGSWKDCDTTGTSGMTSFTLAGSSGTSQTISDGTTLTIAAGNGITTTAASSRKVTVDLSLTSSGTSSTTSANSGLEVTSSGLGLLRGCSNNQVLQWNSSTSVWACATASGSVGGSGSAGQLTYWSDSSTLSGSSNLFFDTTNNRLGILTSSPSSTFSVGATSQFQVNSSGAIAATTAITASGNITTSGNISTSGSGTITSAGLLTGSAGLTVTGGAVSLNASSNNNTSINTGTSTGTVSIGNSAAGALTLASGNASSFTVTGGNLTLQTATSGTLALTSAGALNLTTTTTPQTFTSSATTGTTTSAAFVFNASSLTTGTSLYLTSTATSGKLIDLNASQTSGTISNLAYGSSTTLSGTLTAQAIDLSSTNLTASNQSVTGSSITIPTVTNNGAGTYALKGLVIATGSGSGINTTGTGTTTFTGVDITVPALTQTSGTLTGNGVLITTPSSITTGGTANGINIAATQVGAGSLNGIYLSKSSAGASSSEYAINIANTTWDAALVVGATTVVNGSGVVQVAAGGTNITSYTAGDLIYASGATTLTTLAGGSSNNGKVLTVSSGLPSWGTIAGSSCTDCLVNDPTSAATNTIAPSGNITGLTVKQTSTASPTADIFDVTDKNGTTKYFYVDSSGNVSTGGTSSTTLTLTPTSDTTALTLVGTNVSSQALEYVNSKNASATSGIINLAYGAAQTLTGSIIGVREDLSTNVTATNQAVTGTSITLPAATNTITSGSKNYEGLIVTGGALNQNGTGGTTNYIGTDITIPALTQTLGTLNAYGVEVTTPSSITTGGTAAGLYVNTSGVGAGTLYGVNIGGITAGAGSEYALNIGSGWDRDINFVSTSPSIVVADTGTINFKDSAGNTLCSIVDAGTAGTFSCGSSGSNGYWTRSGTTISPATSTDLLSVTPTLSSSGQAFNNAVTISGSSASQTYYGQKLAVTNNQTSNADTAYGQYISFADAGSLANTVTALYVDATTANASDTTYAAVFQGGNVGIGTTAPSYKLEVSPGNNSSANFAAINTNGNVSGTSGNQIGIASDLNQNATTTGNLYGVWSRIRNGAFTLAGGVDFYAATPTNSGTMTNTYGIYIDSQTNGTQTNTPFGLYQAGSSDYNYFAGKVGIGTSAPGSALTVSGTMTQSGGAASLNASSNFNTSINTGTSTGSVSIGNTAAGAVNITTNAASIFAFKPNTAATFSITDQTNSYLTLNTQTATSGVSAFTFTPGSAASIASGASVQYTTATFTPGTLTFTGTIALTGTGTGAGNIGQLINQQTTQTNNSSGTETIAETDNLLINGPSIATDSTVGGTGTITNAYALNILAGSALNGTRGSVTNGYGLAVNAPTGAGTNYAAVFNGGNLGIGNTAPSQLLSVGASSIFTVSSAGLITTTPSSNSNALTITGSSITSANLLNLDTRNTSGTLINLAYGAATTQGAATLTGTLLNLNTSLTTPAAGQNITGIDLRLPVASTTSNTTTYSGYTITSNGSITNGTAGSFTWDGFNATIPNITQSAGGSLTANGALITTGTITTAGTQNGINLVLGTAAAGTGNGINISSATGGAGTLNGINIASLTSAGAGTETAINVGSSWDNVLTVNSTAILNGSGVLQSAGLSGTYSNALTLSSASNVFTVSTINGLAITNNGTNTLTIAAGKTLTVNNSLTFAGTDSTTMTFPSSSTTVAGLGIAQTFTGANTFSVNGAASTPAVSLTGTWFTGGTATTTKPQLLIEPSGTTSTNWSTSGTGFGINAATTFAGNLFDFQQNAVSLFKLTSASSAVNGFSFSAAATGGGVSFGPQGSDATIALTIDSKAGGTLNLGNGNTGRTINLGSGTGGNTINIAGTGATGADTINIGTGGTSADTITIGNNASSTSLAFTSGTGSQTFTSSVVSGTTTTSGFVFTDNTTLTGTESYIGSTGVTTGTLLNVDTGSANTLTTGKLLSLTSTSTGLTTGNFINSSYTGTAGFSGNLNFFDYSPSSSPGTAASGDILRVNLGANGSNFTGNLFNVINNTSSLFAVSQAAVTASIPNAVTAAGDVSIAYDINFTNPTSSFIKSEAPINIQAGETFNSSNLTLSTFNQGSIVFNSANTTTTSLNYNNASLTTGTGFNFEIDGLTTGSGININSTATGVTTGSLLNVSTGTTGAVATNGIVSINATGAYTSTSNIGLLNLNASATTGGTVENLSAAALTTGVGLNISTAALTTGQALSITAGGATALTSGAGLLVTGPTGAAAISANSGLVQITATGALTTQTGAGSGGLVDIQDNAIITGTLASISDTAVMTGNGNLLTLTANAATTTTGLLTINGTGLTAGTGNAIYVNSKGAIKGSNVVTGGNSNSPSLTLEGNGFTAGPTNTTGSFSVQAQPASATTAKLMLSVTGWVTTANLYSWDQAGNVISKGTDTNSSTPDLAENIPVSDMTIEAGDVVSVDQNAQGDGSTYDNFKAKKSSSAYDSTVLGVISTDPGVILHAPADAVETGQRSAATDRPLTIAGRTPVKVSIENGSIQKGDYLTASSTPGVAMKATKPGAVIGKALEDFSGGGSGQILALVNLSYADPSNFLASLSFDDQGNLIIPNLKTDKLTVTQEVDVTGNLNVDGVSVMTPQDASSSASVASQDSTTQYSDLSGQIASLSDRVTALEAQLAALQTTQTNQITLPDNLQASASAQIAESSSSATTSSDLVEATASASPSADLALEATSSATPSGQLTLTPASYLLASSSASLTDLTVANSISTLDLITSDTFKSLGQTFLGTTTIAGDLSVDGTFSVTGGNSINALPSLYVQNNNLASLVDFFNGALTISKDGTLIANIVSTNEIRLATGQSVGSSKITTGSLSVDIPSIKVTPTSHILLTPTNNTNQVLSVSQKVPGQKFTVTLTSPALTDINFDWLIVNEK